MNIIDICVGSADFERLRQSVCASKPCAVTGCTPSYRALIISRLCALTSRPALVVCASESEAERFASDMRCLTTGGVFVLPARDLILGGVDTASHEYEREALGVLDAAARGKACAIITTPEALCRFTLPPEVLKNRTLSLKAGQSIAPSELANRLIESGYISCDPVTAKGQFCIRGGIFDVFPANSDAPLRLEFWGDSIDRMAYFDPDSQRRGAKAERIRIVPAREIFDDNPEEFAEKIETFSRGLRGKNSAVYREKAADDAVALREGRRITWERYYNLIFEKPATVLDYLSGPMCFISDYSRTRESAAGFETRFRAELAAAFEQGLCAKGADNFYLDASLMFEELSSMGSVCFEAFANKTLSTLEGGLIAFGCRLNSVWNGSPQNLNETLSELREKGWKAAVLAPTAKAIKGISADLTAAGFSCCETKLIPDSDTKADPKADVLLAAGALWGGFELPEQRFAVITGAPARAVKARPVTQRKNAFMSVSELKPGAYVVHQHHGIGVYRGVVTLTAGGATKDYIQLSYAGTDTLYLPVTQLDTLTKYIGPEDDEGKVKLNRLGGAEWQRTRSKVKAAVKDMAKELIALYAKRRGENGHAFCADTPWQREFEDRFEYTETDDQLRCVEEIKADMESSAPMDRLLCGDVGVGKTEVALRAVFKCVLDGKQAAILAPTTILSWQHYETLNRRMSGFGVNMGLLSRFASPRQSSKTVSELRTGKVDVVVGTHRLLQKDIDFKNLGLIVVDEEQRFGVAQKEKLKQKFPGVDVLTLSATPIPRTMNMAISGIRDMSLIDEPPVDRHPVQTFVCEFDLPMLADAAQREIRRGGQVYWLHNRIDDIASAAGRIASLLPEARIVTAHGRMDKEELSDIWRRMMDAEIDILVCTTIIEAGVDLPNVNTLIVENAERMGLSQLHQIRGRVGRSPRRAYAYLTYRPERALSEVQEKRLEAINEFTEFGAGYSLAVRDMEIRGAGNLLGAQQHGHMISVGYDMYLTLLSEAVAEEKGEKPTEKRTPCQVDLPVDAFIPPEYIESTGYRLDIYRKIAASTGKASENAIIEELGDRFGTPPPQVEKLMEVARIRNRATALGITELSTRSDGIVLFMNNTERESVARLSKLLKGRVMASPNATRPNVYIRLGKDDPCELAARVLDILSAPPPQAG